MPNNHEDLVCWQLADKLRQIIIAETADGKPAARDLRFTNNLRDAIGSACRNQAEGFYKFRHREMRPFFNTARASLGEVKDGIREGGQRKYFAPEAVTVMETLCHRAMGANLRFLQSLKRDDPDAGGERG